MVRMYQHLTEERKEFVLSKQVLRSGTSIGANVEEAIGGQSGRDFVARMTIAYKEARETHYWLRLLRDAGYLSETESVSIMTELRGTPKTNCKYHQNRETRKAELLIPNS